MPNTCFLCLVHSGRDVERCFVKSAGRLVNEHTRVPAGARDRASPSFMGLASLGLGIGVFCALIYSIAFFYRARLWG